MMASSSNIFFLIYMLCIWTTCSGAHYRDDYTFQEQANGWFKVHPMPTNWETAKTICHYEGAELASPLTGEIMTVIKDLVFKPQQTKTRYFSGVHSRFGPGVFTSVEGVPLEKFQNNIVWANNEPNNLGKKENCLVFSENGMLDYDCEETLPYICYRNKTAANMLHSECDTTDGEYYPFSGNCYKIHNHAVVWPRAQQICHAERGYLAIINNKKEADFVNRLINFASPAKYTKYSEYSVGFFQWKPQEWYTVHGQTLAEAGYETWAEGEPNNLPHHNATLVNISQQVCGSYLQGKFYDIWCDEPLPFICEKYIYSPTKE